MVYLLALSSSAESTKELKRGEGNRGSNNTPLPAESTKESTKELKNKKPRPLRGDFLFRRIYKRVENCSCLFLLIYSLIYAESTKELKSYITALTRFTIRACRIYKRVENPLSSVEDYQSVLMQNLQKS